MSTKSAIALLMLSSLLLLALAGCSDDETSPTASEPIAVDDYQTMDFDAPYGGLTKSDEEPAFGDPYLEQETALMDGEAFEDELADDPDVRRYMRMGEQPGEPSDPRRPHFTFLRLTWGNLEALPDSITGRVEDGELVDWSGLLRVDRGIVVIRRVILFERPWDGIVRPRPDRQTVAWNSHTGGHVDGLLVQIIEPPRDEDGDGAIDPGKTDPNQLHVVTPQFEQSFLVDDIPSLDAIFPAATEGEAIHLAGFNLSGLDPCPKGFLAGVWHDDPATEDGSGYFRGRWVGLYGVTEGHLMGAYGFTEDGERVFFGKYITRGGQFRGLLRGAWEPGEEPGSGEFRGQWINASEEVEGVLGGRYLDRPERPGGFCQGRWATLCDEEASDQIEE